MTLGKWFFFACLSEQGCNTTEVDVSVSAKPSSVPGPKGTTLLAGKGPEESKAHDAETQVVLTHLS